MTLERFLSIFPRNTRVICEDEEGNELYRGPIWWIDSKYLLSSLVVDVYRHYNYIVVVIVN